MKTENVHQEIDRSRVARKRRERTGLIVWVATVVVILVLLAVLPSKSPLLGTAMVGLAASNAVMRLFIEGRDEWQLHQAIVAFALGAAAGLTSLVVDAVSMAILDSDPNSPGIALSITATSWLFANMVMVLRSDPPDDDDAEDGEVAA